MFNVFDFGAVGDGMADDQPSIQAAINAAVIAGGGEVYLPKPPVSYRIDSSCSLRNLDDPGSLGSNISLRGDGPGSVIKVENADSTAFAIEVKSRNIEISRLRIVNGGVAPTSGYAINLTVGGSLWINIHDMIFEGLHGAVGSTAPIPGDMNNNVLITNCIATDIKGIGFFLQSALDWVISGSLVEIKSTAAGTGLVLETNSEGLYATNSLFLGGKFAILMNHGELGSPPKHHNFFQVAGDGAGTASWQINACMRSRMVNCWAASVQHLARGVAIHDSGFTSGIVWDGGIALNCGGEGIQINGGTQIFIQGAHVISNSRSAKDMFAGIAVGAGVSDFVIRDCQIYNDPDHLLLPGRQKHGIQVNTGSSDNYMIINNYLRGNETSGLADEGSGENKVVDNNLL